MKLRESLCLALSYGSAVVRACAGHGDQVREWSQEELDELEMKWGAEVSRVFFLILESSSYPISLNGIPGVACQLSVLRC